MVENKCPICKSKAENCSCKNICKTCLKNGNYTATGTGECTCCEICKKPSSENCGCCTVCRRIKDSCKCANVVSKATRTVRNPPSIKNLIEQGKDYLPAYVSLLRRWARSGGFSAEDQADELFLMIAEHAPAIYKKLNTHFGDELVGDTAGTEKIILWLEEEYGMTQKADLLRVFNNLMGSQRTQEEDLIQYVQRFENAYQELTRFGEEFSNNLRALILLYNARLPDIDLQIITANLNFCSSDVRVQSQIYDQTKQAIKAHQHIKTANKPTNPTFLTNMLNIGDESLQSFSREEIEEAVKLVLLERRGGARGGRGQTERRESSHPAAKKKVWKCFKCLCHHPLKAACTCPCTQHKHWECPKPSEEWLRKQKEKQEAEEEEAAGTPEAVGGGTRNFLIYSKQLQEGRTMTLVVKKITAVKSGEFQPLNILKKALKTEHRGHSHRRFGDRQQGNDRGEGSSDPSYVPSLGGTDDVAMTKGEAHKIFVARKTEETQELSMIIDSASPSTIVSLNIFKEIKQQYPKSIVATLQYEQSNQQFEFGGKETTFSMGVVTLPIYLQDTDDNFHLVWVKVEVLDIDDVPFLLGGRSLRSVGAVWDFDRSVIAMKTRGDAENKSEFNVNKADSDHFKLTYFPMSKGEGDRVWRDAVEENTWTQDAKQVLVSYALTNSDADSADIIDEEINKVRTLVDITKHSNKLLTSKEIFHLHHFFGHCSEDCLKDLIKQAGRHWPDTDKHLNKVGKCEVCAEETTNKFRVFQDTANILTKEDQTQSTTIKLDVLLWRPDDKPDRSKSRQVTRADKTGSDQAEQQKSYSAKVHPESGAPANVILNMSTHLYDQNEPGDPIPIQQKSSANSTPKSATVAKAGNPVTCNFCHQEISSKVGHCKEEHEITRGNIRNIDNMVDVQGDLVNNKRTGKREKSKAQEVFYFYERRESETESVFVVNTLRVKVQGCVAAEENKLSQETTQILILNIGDLNKAALMRVTDASARHYGCVFHSSRLCLTDSRVIIFLSRLRQTFTEDNVYDNSASGEAVIMTPGDYHVTGGKQELQQGEAQWTARHKARTEIQGLETLTRRPSLSVITEIHLRSPPSNSTISTLRPFYTFNIPKLHFLSPKPDNSDLGNSTISTPRPFYTF